MSFLGPGENGSLLFGECWCCGEKSCIYSGGVKWCSDCSAGKHAKDEKPDDAFYILTECPSCKMWEVDTMTRAAANEKFRRPGSGKCETCGKFGVEYMIEAEGEEKGKEGRRTSTEWKKLPEPMPIVELR